jgi:hypothetical protein
VKLEGIRGPLPFVISFGPGYGVELTATELVPVGQKTIQGPVALVAPWSEVESYVPAGITSSASLG